jgi:hypothetical protein
MAPEMTSWRAVDSELGLFAVGGDSRQVGRVVLPNELASPLPEGEHSAVVDEAAEQLAA